MDFALFRAYDPAHARWLNRDPIAEAGGVNLYAYVEGNPTSETDPLGLWASKLGFHVHQRAGYLVFGDQLTRDQLMLIAIAHAWMDADSHQTSAYDFMHAMRRPDQSVAAACAQNNAFLKNIGARALAAKAAGNTDEALIDFALQTMQDSTSPAHQGFQVWSGNEEGFWAKVGHASQELMYPGKGSSLDQITKQAWNAFQAGDIGGFKVSCGCQ